MRYRGKQLRNEYILNEKTPLLSSTYNPDEI